MKVADTVQSEQMQQLMHKRRQMGHFNCSWDKLSIA